MGIGRSWSAEEIAYLEEKWGVTSIPAIAKKLNRSINSIKCKAKKIGLGRFYHQG